jgi:transcriptional regulator with XRE-family HTH domain
MRKKAHTPITLFQQLNNEYGIHKAVHAWMILHDFTSEQLAAQAGLSPRHVNRWLRNWKIDSPKIEQAASQLFGFDF